MSIPRTLALAAALLVGCAQSPSTQEEESSLVIGPAPARASGGEQSKKPSIGSKMYVVEEALAERSSPQLTSEATNIIYRGQLVTVYGHYGEWVNISGSPSYPSWVPLVALSKVKPDPAGVVSIPAEFRDSRIAEGAIPERPGRGLTSHDVLVLWRGAKHFLASGVCKGIDYADKSTSRQGVYFVQEGYQNYYFTEEDLDQ